MDITCRHAFTAADENAIKYSGLAVLKAAAINDDNVESETGSLLAEPGDAKEVDLTGVDGDVLT